MLLIWASETHIEIEGHYGFLPGNPLDNIGIGKVGHRIPGVKD